MPPAPTPQDNLRRTFARPPPSSQSAATGNALVSRASNGGGGGLRAKVRAAASLSRRSPPPPPRAAFDPFDVDADPPPRLELTPGQVGHCSDALAHLEEKRKRLSDLSEEFGSLKVWMIICSILVGSTCVIVLKSLQHMGTCGSQLSSVGLVGLICGMYDYLFNSPWFYLHDVGICFLSDALL